MLCFRRAVVLGRMLWSHDRARTGSKCGAFVETTIGRLGLICIDSRSDLSGYIARSNESWYCSDHRCFQIFYFGDECSVEGKHADENLKFCDSFRARHIDDGLDFGRISLWTVCLQDESEVLDLFLAENAFLETNAETEVTKVLQDCHERCSASSGNPDRALRP